MQRKNILYLFPGPVPPDTDPARIKFYHLPDELQGNVLNPVWFSRADVAEEKLGKGRFPSYRVKNFFYQMFLTDSYPKPLRKLANISFMIRTGLRLHREKKIDVIMSYGTSVTGIAGVLLSILTGARYIAEIPGVPEHAFLFETPNPGLKLRFRKFLSDQMMKLSLLRADHVKLLYDSQLSAYPRYTSIPASIFHDFVPTGSVQGKPAEAYILLVGHPWYRKGVDVLIKAFKQISADFPDFKLSVLGYLPDRSYLSSLAEGNPNIEFLGPKKYSESLDLISRCSLLVLPSRSEAMGRVLLEAMAAGKPVVGSRVTGIPTYIRDGENGLLFENEDHHDLAQKLSQLLGDPSQREKMGQRGLEFSRTIFSGESYAASFLQMIQRVLG